jgi:hypothetical protein
MVVVLFVLISLLPPAISILRNRGRQLKDLSNAKRVAVALREFARDHGGAFPNKEPAIDYEAAENLTSANKSNDAFWWLFPTYVTSEDIFAVKGSAWSPSLPENKLDAPGRAERVETLQRGECAYLYVTGLNDRSNPQFPLLADAGTANDVTVYTDVKTEKGGVWGGKKAIIVFVDGSGDVVPVDDQTTPSGAFVRRFGHAYNIFDKSASTSDDAWLMPANLVLPPE